MAGGDRREPRERGGTARRAPTASPRPEDRHVPRRGGAEEGVSTAGGGKDEINAFLRAIESMEFRWLNIFVRSRNRFQRQNKIKTTIEKGAAGDCGAFFAVGKSPEFDAVSLRCSCSAAG